MEQRGDTVVVEPGGDGAEHRLRPSVTGREPVVPFPLPADLAEGVVGTASIEFVDGHHVGQFEHVDLLELGGGAVLRCHHVERDIGDVGDGGVTLADAGGLHHDQPEPCRGAGHHDQGEPVGKLGGGPPGGQRAEEDIGGVDGVHPDAVTEQGAPAAAPGGIDGQDGDGQLVLLVEPEPSDDLVGQRRLARAAGTGDAQHRRGSSAGEGAEGVDAGRIDGTGLDAGDPAGQGTLIAGLQFLQRGRGIGGQVAIALGDEEVDHVVEAESLPVGG